MYHQNSRATRPTAGPTCADCGGVDRHSDTCPARRDLLDLLDADLARLAAHPGRAVVRILHRAERAALEAAGHPVPRRERGRWSVRVEPLGVGVLRTIRRDGHPVAEIEDVPVSGAV